MPKNVNQIARKFANTLLSAGERMKQSAFHISPTVGTKGDLSFLLKSKGITGQSLYDRKYNYIPLWQWKQLIKDDLTDLKKYLADFSDCDNFAFLFSARMAMLFKVNTCGVAAGIMDDIRHVFSIIVTEGKVYLLETQTDELAEYKGNPTRVGNRDYTVNWVSFF